MKLNMKDQKGNIGVIVSFIIVIGLIGLIGMAIYWLMNQPIKVDPLEGINKVGNSDIPNGSEPNKDQVQTQGQEQKQEQPSTQNKNMEPNARLLKDFTPVKSVSSLEKIDTVVGTGEEVKAGATVTVHYTGAVAATGVIFQSSKDFSSNK